MVSWDKDQREMKSSVENVACCRETGRHSLVDNGDEI